MALQWLVKQNEKYATFKIRITTKHLPLFVISAPHVAGSIALMLSLKPSMTFTQVKSALENNAIRPTVTNVDLNCGKPSNGQSYPNNAFGNGLINVKKAMGI